jgi:CDP-diacylglycerol--serine O-phosphatidyltransferase
LDWPSSRATVMLILTFSLSSLMVSTIQFPSFKELNWRSRATFGYLLVGVLIMILIAVKPEITLFLILSVYIGVSLVLNLFRKLFRSSVPSSSKSENRSTSVIL